MKITFLGTGTSQGIPVIGSDHPVSLSENLKDKRLRSSVLISWNDFNLLIDCGPDFRQQMLTSNCSRLDSILFTHEHADHTSGLDDIRPFSYRQGKIPIYLHKRVLNSLETRFAYIFNENHRYPGAPEFIVNLISKENNFELGGKTIIPIEVLHQKLPVLGFRIDDFAYLTDVKTIEPEELDKIYNLDTLVLNALRFEPHPTHLNIDEAIKIINTIKPKKTYLTHISHNMGFHDEVSKKLPKNVYLSYDGLEIKTN
ncbi:MAG: MBL fold metallo-hydrolase [Bacteroidota bacterium]|nr:MBL fold metallo-hydrolase [Bacteroidota bacterium]